MQPDELVKALTDGNEYALLDVRERGSYARAHLLLAINLPLSRLELHIRRFVPRLSTRIIVCDGGGDLAERAAAVMRATGYSDVHIVDGGVPACAAAGLELFRGHYTLTYAFGLQVAKTYALPLIDAADLKRAIDAGESITLVDSRPFEAFESESIPGAVQASLAELPGLIAGAAPDPQSAVVVNCGAITRGALGAQTLVEAGIHNPVMMLDNGVRGWDLADLEVVAGASARASEVSAGDAAACAQRLAEWLAIPSFPATELERWRSDDSRTLFIVDVRNRQAYEAGHLAGSIWIQGSELAGLFEDHIATMNARICLVDDDGYGAAVVTASWLLRMGWPDIAVLQGGVRGQALETGPEPTPAGEPAARPVARVNHAGLAAAIEDGSALVIDVAHSSSYQNGHIPGAWWTLRASLPALIDRLPGAEHYVLTSEHGRLAEFAAADLGRLTSIPVSVLDGGTSSWTSSGRPLTTGLTRTLGEVDDRLAELTVCPGDDRATVLGVQRRMLTWQGELLQKIERDPTFSFPALPPLDRG